VADLLQQNPFILSGEELFLTFRLLWIIAIVGRTLNQINRPAILFIAEKTERSTVVVYADPNDAASFSNRDRIAFTLNAILQPTRARDLKLR
jgi:hypothetical protein